MIEILFLGTSCMQPTKNRNHSSILLSYGSENILLDCGEGTQRQLKIAGFAATKLTKILITHWHGDHVLGLPGLMQTLGANEYTKKLKIYGPKGTKERINHMLKAFVFDCKIDYEVFEVESERFFESKEFYLEALPLEHSVPCIGYRFAEKDRRRIKVAKVKELEIPDGPLLGKLQEGKAITFRNKKYDPDDLTYLVHGKVIVYVGDSILCNNAIMLAEKADLFICEAAYVSKDEKKAEQYKHMTAKQAALVANKANVHKLVLTHFSQRYKEISEIADDARTYFDKVVCAEDFMKLKI